MFKTTQKQTRRAGRQRALWTIVMGALCMIGCADDTAEQRLEKVRQEIHTQYPDVKQISTAGLADWLADSTRTPPLLLDVREAAEYQASHLKDARRVEPGKPPENWLPSPDSGCAIVVYCSVGERSSKFARELNKLGFRNVFNLDGSIFQWANEGRPLFAGDQPVRTVHPYNRKWGRLLKRELHPEKTEAP